MDEETSLRKLLHFETLIAGIQQISHLLSVDLQEAAAKGKLCGIISASLNMVKDLVCRSRYHTLQSLARSIWTKHAISFATARLPICEDCAIVPI
jgi:hypothetical protein